MVTLIWEGYFEKNILPLLEASLGELSEAHLLFKLSAANNSTMLVLRYFKADIKVLGFSVPRVGFLVVRDPNKLLEQQHSTQLLGVIGCNLIWLGCEEFGRIYGFDSLEKFQCPINIHPVVFTQFCSYYHQQKLWGQTESLSANSNVSQVHVRTSGVNSEVGDGDSSSKVNAVLGQVWVSDSQQPICIPANSAHIVSGKSDRVARRLTCMVEMGSQSNLPMGVVVNRTIVSPKRSKQVPVMLMNTNGYKIWIRQPLLVVDLVEV